MSLACCSPEGLTFLGRLQSHSRNPLVPKVVTYADRHILLTKPPNSVTKAVQPGHKAQLCDQYENGRHCYRA